MGLLEALIGLFLFVLVLNIVFSFVPVPNNIGGAIIAILIIVLVWRLVF